MFSGLKIATKYVCGRGSTPDPAGGAYRQPSCIGEGGEGEKMGDEGSRGKGRRGEGKGMGEGMGFWVKFTPLHIEVSFR